MKKPMILYDLVNLLKPTMNKQMPASSVSLLPQIVNLEKTIKGVFKKYSKSPKNFGSVFIELKSHAE